MCPWPLILVVFLCLGTAAGRAQTAGDAKAKAALGCKLLPVPDAVYQKMPQLEAGQGVLVGPVTPESQAAKNGLRSQDIVLSIGAAPVTSGPALAAKILALGPGEREVLEVLRGGKKIAVSWPRVTEFSAANQAYAPPKSFLKPGGPPAVSVQVQPLDNDRFGMTILYYNSTTGKLDRHGFEGGVATIERQVKEKADQGRIPTEVHDLIGVALQRLRQRAAQP